MTYQVATAPMAIERFEAVQKMIEGIAIPMIITTTTTTTTTIITIARTIKMIAGTTTTTMRVAAQLVQTCTTPFWPTPTVS